MHHIETVGEDAKIKTDLGSKEWGKKLPHCKLFKAETCFYSVKYHAQ